MTNLFDLPSGDDNNPFGNNVNETPNPNLAIPPNNHDDSTLSSSRTTDNSSITGSITVIDPLTDIPVSEHEIAHHEQLLTTREQAIQVIEYEIRSGPYVGPNNRNNWPPLLKWWAYYPDEDLPEQYRQLAKLYFFFFNAQAIPYTMNVVAALSRFGAEETPNVSLGMTVVLSLFFLFVFLPMGYDVVYFAFYDAVVKEKAARFICSLGLYVIWWGVLVLVTMGIGSVGLIPVIDLYKGGQSAIGTIALCVVITSALIAGTLAWIFVELIRLYRTQEISVRDVTELPQIAISQAQQNPQTVENPAI
jgi:hypothetical protein